MIYRKEGQMLNDGELMALLEEATKHGGLVGVHAENADIAEYRVEKYLAEGKRDWNIHALCKPNVVEYEAINRQHCSQAKLRHRYTDIPYVYQRRRRNFNESKRRRQTGVC